MENQICFDVGFDHIPVIVSSQVCRRYCTELRLRLYCPNEIYMYKPRQCSTYMNNAPGLTVMAILMTSLMTIICLLILLSGDVETNPGPLGKGELFPVLHEFFCMAMNGKLCMVVDMYR